MSWTDSQIESLITFYSSMLVSGARNFATGVKNRRQFSGAGFWSVCHQHYESSEHLKQTTGDDFFCSPML